MAEVSHGLILGIISVTSPQYIFLAQNDSILIEKRLVRTRMTGNRIIPSVRSCLDEIGQGIESVDIFLALSGPGSMTGIRAGLAPIRAWAYASGKGVITLPSLSVLANGFPRPTIALMPAGRSNWWIQAFNTNMKDTPSLVESTELSNYDKKEWTWVTTQEASPKHAKMVTHSPTPKQALDILQGEKVNSWAKAVPHYLFEMSPNE